MGEFQFSAQRPTKLLNLNGRESHWSRSATAAAWRKATWVHARNALMAQGIRTIERPVTVLVEFGTKTPQKRRDPHNFVPTVKPIIDGLVDAKVIVDDDHTRVTLLDSVFTGQIPINHYRVTLRWDDA